MINVKKIKVLEVDNEVFKFGEEVTFFWKAKSKSFNEHYNKYYSTNSDENS